MALPAGAQCSAVGDANTATIPGAYRMGAPDLNKPAAGQGQLLVWKSYANYVLQMYVPATAAISNLWTRTSPDLGVTWTPWTTPAAGSTETDNLVVDPNGALGTGAFGGQVVSVVDRYSSGAPSLAPSKVLHKITFTNTNNQYSQVYLDPKRAAGVTSLDNAGAIAVRPGETYTVSFDGFADGVVGGRRIGAIAHCYQANTNVTNLNIAGPTVDANGAWTPYSFTFTVPADIYSIWVRLLAPSGVTTNLYVGNIRVEKLQPQPGLATSGANSNITSLAGLTTPLSVSQGGTGSSTASGALANLGAMPAAGGFYNPDFVSVKVGGTRPNLAAQGMHLLWNTAAGGLTGEGAFVCNKGGGTGGFSWRSIDTGNTTTGPTMTYTYAGVLNVPGAVNQNSDRRLKTNDIEIVDGLERILRVRPVEYDRRDSFDSEEYPHHEVGVIAQELFEIAPLLVTPANPDDAKDAWKVNYTGLIPYLVSAIKTLKAEIEELKSAGK
ncbi:tail fiber domain-containing protein [Pseudomonas sp. ok272]|uniref:tail fiber domain-containing protein n=1 Tax=unclassified Pseudomonas TaxID=196821 RepID=UPI0035323748